MSCTLTACLFSLPQEDLQLILQQQLQSQQQAEQTQKKPTRLGILRRNNRPPIQRPPSFPLSTPAPSTTNSSQIKIPRSSVNAAQTPSAPSSSSTQRNWRDKLRRGKASRHGDQDSAGQDSEWGRDDGFQVVSLDWISDDFALWVHSFRRTMLKFSLQSKTSCFSSRGCLSFAVQNDACTEFDTTGLFSYVSFVTSWLVLSQMRFNMLITYYLQLQCIYTVNRLVIRLEDTQLLHV